jgi:hypothetical protein
MSITEASTTAQLGFDKWCVRVNPNAVGGCDADRGLAESKG